MQCNVQPTILLLCQLQILQLSQCLTSTAGSNFAVYIGIYNSEKHVSPSCKSVGVYKLYTLANNAEVILRDFNG